MPKTTAPTAPRRARAPRKTSAPATAPAAPVAPSATPELDTAFLQQQMQEAAPELVFEQRLPNPEAFADASPERSLKVLLYRAPALPPRDT